MSAQAGSSEAPPLAPSFNASLFRSWHALIALLITGAAAAIVVASGDASGWTPSSRHDVQVMTGLLAGFLMLVLGGYVLRKYMHKLRYSPEFLTRVGMESLESFDRALNVLRIEILRGTLNERGVLEARVREELRRAGVARVQKVVIEPGAEGEPPFILRVRPTEPFGRTARWLHAHIYYGLAFAAVVLLHGGGRSQSFLGAVLNGLTLIVVATGALGLVLWAFGPTWLSRAERRHRLSCEQAFVLVRGYRHRLAEALEPLPDSHRQVLARLRDDPAAALDPQVIRQAQGELRRQDPEGAGPSLDALTLVGQLHRARRAARELLAIRWRFMAWRTVHVPAAVLLLASVAVHVIGVWRF